MRWECCGVTGKEARATLSPPEPQGPGGRRRRWSPWLHRASTERGRAGVPCLGHEPVESTKRRHGGLSCGKFWGTEWAGVKQNTTPRKHRTTNNIEPDLVRTGPEVSPYHDCDVKQHLASLPVPFPASNSREPDPADGGAGGVLEGDMHLPITSMRGWKYSKAALVPSLPQVLWPQV